MNAKEQWQQKTSDPLGLGRLDTIEPGYDGWDEIATALTAHQQRKRNWRRASGVLALAASLVLIISITVLRQDAGTPAGISTPDAATLAAENASATTQENIAALIALSQTMEEQLKQLKQQTGSMPAESAIYVAEIEDLIAQLDSQLNQTPDSVNLWGQRVNLMLDLAQIYQQRWVIDYGRMASL